MPNKKIKLERCENCYKVVNKNLIAWIEVTRTFLSHRGEEETSEQLRWCDKCRKELQEKK